MTAGLPFWVWPLSGFLLGAIIGSFLATLIVRWPDGRSVMAGRSACDACGRSLGPVELVPLLSILLQRGQCRTCAAPIDSLHFRVELACAFAGAAALGLAPGIAGLGGAIFAWFLIVLGVLDYRHFWLPDALTLPLAFLGFALAPWVNEVPLMDRAIGAAAGYGGLMLIATGYRHMRGRDGMGGGDPKLLGAIGAWMGWQLLPLVLLFASTTALAIAALHGTRGGAVTSTTPIPLGAYLALAALPAWLLAGMTGLV